MLGKQPPKIFVILLMLVVSARDRESLAGDFAEMYERITSRSGLSRALFWYFFQIIKLIPKMIDETVIWGVIMFKNYFKIAFRNMIKYKVFSFINIFGLSVGMACCIVILLWVQSEFNYDGFHDNLNNLYRCYQIQKYSGEKTLTTDNLPGPLAEFMQNEFPEIDKTTRFLWGGPRPVKYNDIFHNEDISFADQAFFEMFTFPLKYGNKHTVLKDPFSVVISQTLAEKYFGSENPVGKVLTLQGSFDFTVTGVMYDISTNSHLSFVELVVPFVNTQEIIGLGFENWYGNWPRTFLLLKDGMSPDQLQTKIVNVLQDNSRVKADLFISPVKHNNLYTLKGEPSFIEYVYMFTAIAFIILFIASINFINLSTAKANVRAKEVGIRKVAGAYRISIIQQFFGESILQTFVAIIFAVLMVLLTIPYVNEILTQLSGVQISFDLFENSSIILIIIGVAVAAGLLAGSYPAFYVSSFTPVNILKGLSNSGKRKSRLRKVLVIGQFTVSAILIIGTIVISNQLTYINDTDLGYNEDNLLTINLRGDAKQKYQALKNRLLSNSNIVSVTGTDKLPTSTGNSSGGFDWEGKDPELRVLINTCTADFNYVDAMGMEIIEGRNFLEKSVVDSGSYEYIFNEEAIRRMGIENPIGKWFDSGSRNGKIIGIVKDFHFATFRQGIDPILINANPKDVFILLARIGESNVQETIKFVENTWFDLNPNLPFDYTFLDDDLNRLYGIDVVIGNLYRYFALIAVLVACLGLFGLASFTAERRTKEIGIRKALGSSVSSIFALLSKEFVKWVLIANLFAWPVAYYLMSNWLNRFAYRISLEWWVFLLTGLIALAIAIITVSFQVIKASMTNPSDALKYE